MTRVNILWFDDDLLPRGVGVSAPRARLQAWLKWFYTAGAERAINLIEVNSLRKLGETLRLSAELDQSHPDYIHAILIDQLHHPAEGSSSTLSDLDDSLAHVRLLELDAGTQLVELIMSTSPSTPAPTWLSSHFNRNIALFSTLPIQDTRSDLGLKLQHSILLSLSILQKHQSVDSSGEPTPDATFVDWVDSVCRSTSALRATVRG